MARKAVAPKWNQKVSISQFKKQFKFKDFDMKDDAIDLREMCKNFDNGIIPLESVHQAIVAVLGNKGSVSVTPYDPSGGATINYPVPTVSPRFGYIEWDEGYLWPIFQRDVAPNHVAKIRKNFDPTCIIVPCAIKLTLKNGVTIYCIWDGHHTMQVCRLMGYTKFPVWYIDIDHVDISVIENAGFAGDDDGRIAYGVWLAGTNMRNINGKMKRALSPYDDFMIGCETRDDQCVSMMNILKKHGCKPVRHGTKAGHFSQIKSGIECYELVGDNPDVKGKFWDRAIAFHRKHWNLAPLELELFRPMSYLYQRAEIEGITLPAKFDEDLAKLLIKKYGDPESIQTEIKKSFIHALETTGIKNAPPDGKFNVLCGIICLAEKNLKGFALPTPEYRWNV